MNISKRPWFAWLALVSITAFLLLTVRGPVMQDGVAFYAPITLGALLAWRFVTFRKKRSRSFTFLTGAAGGLVGTLSWPTWILVWLMLTGTADPAIMPLVMFFAICFVASVLGGVVAMILAWGFDRKSESEPSFTQTDSAHAANPIANAV